jgi:hypothetical protein
MLDMIRAETVVHERTIRRMGLIPSRDSSLQHRELCVLLGVLIVVCIYVKMCLA